MARPRRFDRITGNFSSGVLSEATQDNVRAEVWANGAAEITNFRIERDGGLSRRPAFRRTGLVVPTPLYGCLDGKAWSTGGNSTELQGGGDATSGFLPSGIYRPGENGIASLLRRFTTESTDPEADLLRIDLGGTRPAAIALHGVRLEQGRFQGTDAGVARLTFSAVRNTMDGEILRSEPPVAQDATTESPLSPGVFVPGQIGRDVVIPFDTVEGRQGLDPLEYFAIRVKRSQAETPITISVEGVSCFATDPPLEPDGSRNEAQVAQIETLLADGGLVRLPRRPNGQGFFRTPARIIPWQIRDIPFVIVLGLDWLGWAQLVPEPELRQSSLSAWHFTERQLRELTWAWFGGELLLLHHDFPMPLQIVLPSGEQPISIQPLELRNVPQLPDAAFARALPDVTLRGELVEIGEIRPGGGPSAVPVAPAFFNAVAGDGRVGLFWPSTGATSYEVWSQPKLTFDAIPGEGTVKWLNDDGSRRDGVNVNEFTGVGTVLAPRFVEDLENATEYVFTMRSRIRGDTSTFSVTRTARPLGRLETPTNLRGTSPVTGEPDRTIRIEWDPSLNAVAYAVRVAPVDTPIESVERLILTAPMHDYLANAVGETIRVVVLAIPTAAFPTPEDRATASHWTSLEAVATFTVRGSALDAPSPITVSAGALDGQLEVDWPAVGGASGYEVESKLSSDTGWDPVSTTSETSATVQGVAGSVYNVRVRTLAPNRVSSDWAEASPFTAVNVPPAAPSQVRASSGGSSTSVKVEWEAGERADSYRIQWADRAGFLQVPQVLQDQVVSSGTEHTFTGLTSGAQYWFRVRSERTGGISPSAYSPRAQWVVFTPGAATIGTPPAPTLTPSARTSGLVEVSWSPDDPLPALATIIPGADQYDIRYQPIDIDSPVFAPASVIPITLVQGQTQAYSHQSTGGTGHVYSIRGRDSASGRVGTWGPGVWTRSPVVLVRPPRPGAPTVTPSSTRLGGISASWAAVAGATSYNVRYRIQGTGNEGWTSGGSTSTTQSRVFILVPGRSYDFQVQAVNAGGSSAYSLSGTGIAAATGTTEDVPGIPSGLTVVAGTVSGSINVSWDATARANSYLVQERRSDRTAWTDAAANPITGTSYSFSGTPGRSYDFRVAATNLGGSSQYSAPRTAVAANPATTLARPGRPTVTNDTSVSGRGSVSWGAVTGATGYNIRIQVQGTTGWSTTSGVSRPYTYNRTPGTTYNVQVQAVAGGQSSLWSDSATWTPQEIAGSLVAPAVPRAVADSQVSGRIRVSWSSVRRANRYDLQHRLSTTQTWTTVESVTSPYTFNGVGGNTYVFRIKALDTTTDPDTESAWSGAATVLARTITARPATPSNFRATASTTQSGGIVLTWNAVAGATAYEVRSRWTGSTGVVLSQRNWFRRSSGYVFQGIAGREYEFQVRAVNAGGSSDPSPTRTATAPTISGAPATPTGLTATASTTAAQIALDWNDSTGATSYDWQWKRTIDPNWLSANISNVTSSQATFTGASTVSAGNGVDFRVRAKNASGSSPWSASRSANFPNVVPTPAVPTGLMATQDPNHPDRVALNWNRVANAHQYIYQWRRTSGGTANDRDFTKNPVRGITATSAIFDGELNVPYQFRVRSVRTSGATSVVSAFSSPVSHTTPNPPAVPSEPTVTSAGIRTPGTSPREGRVSTRYTITWPSVPGATGYDLQRESVRGTGVLGRSTGSASSGVTYTVERQLGSTQRDRQNRFIYRWKVRSRNASGASAWSVWTDWWTHEGTEIPDSGGGGVDATAESGLSELNDAVAEVDGLIDRLAGFTGIDAVDLAPDVLNSLSTSLAQAGYTGEISLETFRSAIDAFEDGFTRAFTFVTEGGEFGGGGYFGGDPDAPAPGPHQ